MERTLTSFDQYYRKYLCIDAERMKSGRYVFPCKRRSKPLAFFYIHHLICTVIEEKIVVSISPELAPAFEIQRKYLPDNAVNKNTLRMIDDIIFEFLPALLYSTRLMSRMTIEKKELEQKESSFQITTLSEADKTKYTSLCKNTGKKKADYLWNARVESVRAGRYFCVIKNDTIVSSSFISDIDHHGANIVVSTSPEYRNKGYGKAVVRHASEWCFMHGHRPIYLVDANNIPSVRLAESLGFKNMSSEIVVSSYGK